MSGFPEKIGKYQILGVIGKGGMGIVYKARHPVLDVDVAIKVLPASLARQDPTFKKRFLREAHIMSELSYPSIVRVVDGGIWRGSSYLVMDFIDGATLTSVLRRLASPDIVEAWMGERDKGLPQEAVVHMGLQAAKALEYAHEHGVIHRDIKPSNILLDRNRKAYLTDFGVARMLADESSLTVTGMAWGTPEYMAPEEFTEGSHAADAQTDIYSLGVVLYESLLGRVPFEGDTPISVGFQHVNIEPLMPHGIDLPIDPFLESVVLKMLEKDRSCRYKSCGEVVEDLELFQRGDSGHVRRISGDAAVQQIRPSSLRNVVFESSPLGARVYVDGRIAGVTPAVGVSVERGEHSALFVLRGYEEQVVPFAVLEDAAPIQVSAALSESIDGEAVVRADAPTAIMTGIVLGLSPRDPDTMVIGKVAPGETLSEDESIAVPTTAQTALEPVGTIVDDEPGLHFSLEATVPPPKRRSWLMGTAVALATISIMVVVALAARRNANIAGAPPATSPTSPSVSMVIPQPEAPEQPVVTKPAASASTEATTGSIEVESTPSGARILIDSKPSDLMTPAVVSSVLPGTHRVDFAKDGYNDVTGYVYVRTGEQAVMTMTLAKTVSTPPTQAVGALRVSTDPDGALVTIDGVARGKSPITVSGLAVGTHRLQVTKAGRKTVTQSVSIGSGTRTANVTLQVVVPLTARFQVRTEPPGADVYVNGQLNRWKTPCDLVVLPGVVGLRIAMDGYSNTTRAYVVKAGQTVTTSIVLVMTGEGD